MFTWRPSSHHICLGQSSGEVSISSPLNPLFHYEIKCQILSFKMHLYMEKNVYQKLKAPWFPWGKPRRTLKQWEESRAQKEAAVWLNTVYKPHIMECSCSKKNNNMQLKLWRENGEIKLMSRLKKTKSCCVTMLSAYRDRTSAKHK